MNNWRVLQVQVNEWATRNFGERQPHQPLLGLQEEVGELAHAHLKMEQGIRGTKAKHRAAKIDAVGDIAIYLADYCNANNLSLSLCIEATWDKVKRRDWKKDNKNGGAQES